MKRLALALAALALVGLMLAATAPALADSGPQGAVAPATGGADPWAVVTMWNNQSSGTGAPFSERIGFDAARYSAYLVANLSNLRFTYPNGTTVFAWIEANDSNASTNVVLFLNLTWGIPAMENATVLAVFDPLTDFDFGVAGPTGIMPRLSPTYGEWDDGWRVFPVYANFSGTHASLPAPWVANDYGESLGSFDWDNGIDLTTTDSQAIAVYTSTTYLTYPFTEDTGMLVPDFASGGSNVQLGTQCDLLFVGSASESSWALAYHTSGGGCAAASTGYDPHAEQGAFGVLSVGVDAGDTIVRGLYNYSVVSTVTTTAYSFTAPLWLGLNYETGGTTTYYFADQRESPPDAVMPPSYSGRVMGVPSNAPTDLQLAAIGQSYLVVAWTPASDYNGTILNYTVLTGPTCADLTGSASTGGPATLYELTGLSNGTAVAFKVEAWNAYGASPRTGCVLGTTLTSLRSPPVIVRVNSTLNESQAGVILALYVTAAAILGGTVFAAVIARPPRNRVRP